MNNDDANIELRQQFKNITYYFLIGVVSIVLVTVGPLIAGGINGTIQDKFPTNALGWVFWVLSRLSVSFLNILLFTLFIRQAKVNVRNNPKYKEAIEILSKDDNNKAYQPRSEKQYDKKNYLMKLPGIFGGSLLSLFALSSLILNYDATILISYICTWVFGIIFGIMAMKDKENFLCTEFYDYAKRIEKQRKENIKQELPEEAKEDKTVCLSTEIKN